MKKFLEEFGIHTINDLICNIGGFLVLCFVVHMVIGFGMYIFYDKIPLWFIITYGVNIILIVLCFILDKKTK